MQVVVHSTRSCTRKGSVLLCCSTLQSQGYTYWFFSYGQAGLSVLQSFAYGVPYITCKDAISGGEHKNIVHKMNGLLFDDQYSIEDAINDLILDKDFAIKLGKNAYNYYSKFCTIEEMAKGFHEAINLNE